MKGRETRTRCPSCHREGQQRKVNSWFFFFFLAARERHLIFFFPAIRPPHCCPSWLTTGSRWVSEGEAVEVPLKAPRGATITILIAEDLVDNNVAVGGKGIEEEEALHTHRKCLLPLLALLP